MIARVLIGQNPNQTTGAQEDGGILESLPPIEQLYSGASSFPLDIGVDMAVA